MIQSSNYNLTSAFPDSNAAELQRFFNDAAGLEAVLEPGLYNISGLVQISAGVKLHAHGATLQAASLATDAPLLTGSSGVVIEDLKVKGPGKSIARSVELVSFSGAVGIRLRNVKISDAGHIGVAFGNCRDVKVSECELWNLGRPDVTTEGGPAIWIGMGSYDVTIDDNHMHDCEWAGMYATGVNLRLSKNRIYSCKEAGIFGQPVESSILANNISNISRKYISASGIELGALQVAIMGNTISNVHASCIALTDSQNITVSGNSLANPKQDGVYYPRGSGVSVITTNPAPSQPKWATIVGNTFTGFAPPYAFVDVGGNGAPVDYLTVKENSCGGISFASGVPVNFQAGKQGYGCIF